MVKVDNKRWRREVENFLDVNAEKIEQSMRLHRILGRHSEASDASSKRRDPLMERSRTVEGGRIERRTFNREGKPLQHSLREMRFLARAWEIDSLSPGSYKALNERNFLYDLRWRRPSPIRRSSQESLEQRIRTEPYLSQMVEASDLRTQPMGFEFSGVLARLNRMSRCRSLLAKWHVPNIDDELKREEIAPSPAELKGDSKLAICLPSTSISTTYTAPGPSMTTCTAPQEPSVACNPTSALPPPLPPVSSSSDWPETQPPRYEPSRLGDYTNKERLVRDPGFGMMDNLLSWLVRRYF